MPRTYVEPPISTVQRAEAAMAKYHPQLRDAGVTLTILHAHGPRDNDGNPTDRAILVRGHAALACIKITSLRDRAAGLGDAVLIIDGDVCDEWDEERWEAILDRELTRLELKTKTDKTGMVSIQRDDLGRPKLKTRHHDYEIGLFFGVCRRHKEHAVELQSIKSVGAELVKQGCLPGF